MYAVILPVALILIKLHHLVFLRLLPIKHLLAFILHDVHLATTSGSLAARVARLVVIHLWSLKRSVFKSELVVVVLKLSCLVTVRVCVVWLVQLHQRFFLQLERELQLLI